MFCFLQSAENDRANFQDLLLYLRPVTEWKMLGVQLLPEVEIQIIHKNHQNDVEKCQFELFTKYMQMGDGSWNTVIAALMKCGYIKLAKEIKQKFNL